MNMKISEVIKFQKIKYVFLKIDKQFFNYFVSILPLELKDSPIPLWYGTLFVKIYMGKHNKINY